METHTKIRHMMPGMQTSSMAGEASSLQSRLPLPTPAMLSVKRSCLVQATALAVLCVNCLVRLTPMHSENLTPCVSRA